MKNALLSYIVQPFRLPPDHPDNLRFSNVGLAKTIYEALGDLGYETDVIEYTDTDFASGKAYDLVVYHGGVNFDHLAGTVAPDAVKAYFSTGSYWKTHNENEVARFEDLRRRRGVDLPLDRYIDTSEEEANRRADGIICLGNAAAKDTYAGFPLVVNLNNAAYADDYCDRVQKDFGRGRRGFLFFGAVGSVHKGLDLLIETFLDLDCELYVCGSLEPHFLELYREELSRAGNIHLIGWVTLRSRAFYDLMNRCNYVIFPSASEGQPGSVVECMHRGLVPIVSEESHIDTGDFGVTLSQSTVDEITSVVKEAAARPTDWCAQMAQRTCEAARRDHSVDGFRRQFMSAIEAIVSRAERSDEAAAAVGASSSGVAVPLQNVEAKNHLDSVEQEGDDSRSPVIVIDGVFFQLNNTGIARVWKSLFEVWARNGFAEHVVVLDRAGTTPKIPGISYRSIPEFRQHDSLEDQQMLEEVCRAEHADLFMSTYYSMPVSTPSLLLLYDMIPEMTGMDLSAPPWREKRHAIDYASGYAAISHNTARDLATCFPSIDPESVTIMHCAPDPFFGPATPAEIEDLRARGALPRTFYVYVGCRDNYKNGRLLFRALAVLPDRDECGVLCVGGGPHLEAEFAPLIGNAAVRIAALSDEDLRIAYSAATALVFPSRYEGFGLPIVEAMACGCPVITCRNASIPEVAGDAVVYVDDADPAELAQAMVQVQDPGVRGHYQRLGFVQSKRFSWEKAATILQRRALGMCADSRQGRTDGSRPKAVLTRRPIDVGES